MIRIMIILSVLFITTDCDAGDVFYGYDAFYKTLPNRIFSEPSSPLPSRDTLGNMHDDETSDWIIADKNIVKINGQKFKLTKAIPLLNEPITERDVGRNPELYTQERYYCILGHNPTSSGTAWRYNSVYLIDRKTKKIFKFPGLFSSCLSLGKDENQHITFFEAKIVNYRAAYDADGVELQEYVLKGKKVSKTSKIIRAKFINSDDFFQFTIEK